MEPKFEIGETVRFISKTHDLNMVGKVLDVYKCGINRMIYYDFQDKKSEIILEKIPEAFFTATQQPTLKILFKYHPKPVEVEDIEFEMI